MTAETHTSERPVRLRMAFQFFMLFLLLVATPYFSWYYLQKGLDYRIEQLDQLFLMGPAPSGEWVSRTGVLVHQGQWKEQLSVVVLSETEEQLGADYHAIQRLYGQFHDRQDVLFYHFYPRTLSHSLPLVDSVDQWQQIMLADDDFSSLLGEWSLPLAGQDLQPGIIFVDRQGQIRQSFPRKSDTALKKLVEVIAVMLPPKKVERPELNREPEI